MSQDFQVQIVDQCGGVLIKHASIIQAKEYLAELETIPNARRDLKTLGVQELRILIKLEPDVSVCVGRIKLDPELAIKLDDTWREWCGGFDSVFVDRHALQGKARDDRETPKAQNVIYKKVDRIKTTAKDSRIFAMILGAFKAVARAHTCVYVTADTAVESTKTSEAQFL